MRGILKKDLSDNLWPELVFGAIFLLGFGLSLVFMAYIGVPYDPSTKDDNTFLNGMTSLASSIGLAMSVSYASSLTIGMMMRDMKSGWIQFLVTIGITRKEIYWAKTGYGLLASGAMALLVFPMFFGISYYQVNAMGYDLGYINMVSWLNLFFVCAGMSALGNLAGFAFSPNISSLLVSIGVFLGLALSFGGGLTIFLPPDTSSSYGLALVWVEVVVFLLSVTATVLLNWAFYRSFTRKDM